MVGVAFPISLDLDPGRVGVEFGGPSLSHSLFLSSIAIPAAHVGDSNPKPTLSSDYSPFVVVCIPH